ncbi:MAG: hypothetical protein N2321_09345 [Melioribacteraceae bacterium]|nr:hypothetical protein [Melioribacteraceae bacterium]
MSVLKISTPGRICLFGEHQDYLGLPVIAAAINKRINIKATERNDNILKIKFNNLNSTDEINLSENINYLNEKDYLRSSINVLKRKGFEFSQGFDIEIFGDIPINSGTSSSSALVVAWFNFLIKISNQKIKLTPEEIAYLAYESEVLEFNEPGGMMDHYSTSIGNIIWLQTTPCIKVKKINAELGDFILADSEEPKDTKFILSRVKNNVTDAVNKLKNKFDDFDLQKISIEDLERYKYEISEDQFELLNGTLRNRDITFEAEKVLTANEINKIRIGNLLNEHQKILKDVLQISTNKIDKMIEIALNHGALGAKINGSGGGGCMFAYAPKNSEKIIEELKKITHRTWLIKTDKGTITEYD